ncbi:uncharacterized protein [Atheta coriaria]|uniref:uncharacterized protein n=1 Tax=Dalotia coriaria TaxID=877792 RepID=UPI0031F413C5
MRSKFVNYIDIKAPLTCMLLVLGVYPNVSSKSLLVRQTFTSYRLFIAALLVTFALLVANSDLLKVNFPQNALTRSGFWIQYCSRLILAAYILVLLVRKRELIAEVHDELANIQKNWPPRIHPGHTILAKLVLAASLFVALLTTPIMIVLDAYSDPKNNICVLWCAHLPGLIIHCYVTYMSFMKFQGAQLFDDLNHYFNLIRERLAIKMQQSVNESWNHRQDCICELHKMFKMHFRLTKVIKKLHSIYSNEYLLLVNLTMHGIILLTYIIILDLLRFRGQLGLYPREHYFTEYWILVEILDIGFIIISAHELNVNGGRECPLMHFITKIYKNVDDCISLYSFQLLVSKVSTSAAGILNIEYSTLFLILGTALKYVFIILQFDASTNGRKCM